MRVLIAYDGSEGATEAIALAESIAWPSESLIRVVTVIEPILMAMSGPWERGAGYTPELDAMITDSANDMMRKAVDRLESSGRSVDGQVLRGRGGQRDRGRCAGLPRRSHHRRVARSWGHRVVAAWVRIGRGRRPRALPGPCRPKRDRPQRGIRHRRVDDCPEGRRDPGWLADLCRHADPRRQRRRGDPSMDNRDRPDDVPTGTRCVRSGPPRSEGGTRADGGGRRSPTRERGRVSRPRCERAMLLWRSSRWPRSNLLISSSLVPAVALG